MKLLFIFLLSTIIIISATAQDFEGRIRYTAVIDFSRQEAALKDPATALEKKKQLESLKSTLKDVEEHSYILTFNKYESIYKKEEKLGLKESTAIAANILDYYKNLKNNIYIKGLDVLGNIYFISEKLPVFDWKLHNETKTIGQYTCNKATYTEIKEGRGMTTKADGSIEQTIVKDTATITAWYCPQIPVMNGPDKFTGLPGLILELTKASELGGMPLTLYCTEITLNPKDGVKIKKPNAKKLYTPIEFQLEMLRLNGGR